MRVGFGVLFKTYTLGKKQQEDFAILAANARQMLTALGQEKIAHYSKVAKFTSVAGHLETLERQIRTSMPQHIMDMLEFQATAMSR